MRLSNLDEIGPQPYFNYLNGSHQDDKHLPYIGWNYPTELQNLVHEHWRSFPIPQIYHNAFLFILYFTYMLLSVFGNGLVLWIFTTSKNLRTPSNLLIINLAVFDMAMCCNMPQYLINASFGYIVGGDLACNIYAMCAGVSGIGAAVSNALIAFDRYRTISNPLDGRLSYGQITILILFAWLWTLPFNVMPLFHIWGRFIADGYLTTCSYDYLSHTDENRYFLRTAFIWAYCIPMIIICTYYTKLFLHVRDHERMLAEQAKKMNVKSLSANTNADVMSVELRIAKAALIIYMMYVVSWTPYAAITLLGSFGYKNVITPFVSMIPATTCKAVSCLDPWIYAASHPKYRLELERRLPWLGIREKNIAASGGTVSESATVVVDN